MKPSSGLVKPTSTAKTPLGRHRLLFSDQPKTVYLIRHGESKAQEFSLERRSRDKLLKDCRLSAKGEDQALIIPSILGLDRYRQIDCVISSPATRAVQTSVIAFPSKPIVIHYDLAEIGRDKIPLPENCGRPMQQVLADVVGQDKASAPHIDVDTFASPRRPYPGSHDNLPRSVRKSKLPKVWEAIWDYTEQRNAHEIAVVCHYNVIAFSLGNQADDIKPKNGLPIECRLYRGGFLEVVETHTDKVQEMTETLADVKKRNEWCMQRHRSSIPHMRALDENCN